MYNEAYQRDQDILRLMYLNIFTVEINPQVMKQLLNS